MELEANEKEAINEKQDSIEINRTAKGTYSWKIKRYYNFSDTKHNDIINDIEKIDQELKNKFKTD